MSFPDAGPGLVSGSPFVYTRTVKEDLDNVIEIVARQLPDAGVACLLIGGHAVNYYGYTRATQDLDFMIAAAAADTVIALMQTAGYTNISRHETVVFLNRPGSPLRIDFLKVDPQTIDELMANAVDADFGEGRTLHIPCLRDLLAMKLFALASGSAKRHEKDLPDVVHLVLEQHLSVEEDLKPLCRQYGTDALYDEIRARIKEQQ